MFDIRRTAERRYKGYGLTMPDNAADCVPKRVVSKEKCKTNSQVSLWYLCVLLLSKGQGGAASCWGHIKWKPASRSEGKDMYVRLKRPLFVLFDPSLILFPSDPTNFLLLLLLPAFESSEAIHGGVVVMVRERKEKAIHSSRKPRRKYSLSSQYAV